MNVGEFESSRVWKLQKFEGLKRIEFEVRRSTVFRVSKLESSKVWKFEIEKFQGMKCRTCDRPMHYSRNGVCGSFRSVATLSDDS